MRPPDKHEVKQNYDDLGGGIYELRYREEQTRKYDAAILLARPKGDELLLDDGCGTGMLLQRLDSSVVGLDLSPGMLKTAKENLKENHHLILADAEQLPLKDSVFHNVYAITLIQNTPNKVKTITEIKRVSRPGGVVIVTTLKIIIDQITFKDLLESSGLTKICVVGDAGTNDWIVYAEISNII
jgi:ubiquinone/menaquinone biosynthesis C-methylase UbiE